MALVCTTCAVRRNAIASPALRGGRPWKACSGGISTPSSPRATMIPVGSPDDLIQAIDRRWLFKFRHDQRTVADHGTGFVDVLPALDEEQSHPVHTKIEAKCQYRACCARSKVKGATQHYNAGDIHSLAFRQAAADAYNRICKIRSAIAEP